MLARLAENLFWAGRYLERAEHTARMLDVTYHTLLESPAGEVGQSWGQLLDVLNVRADYVARVGDGPVEPDRVLRLLVLDRDVPGSVTHSVVRARENVRSVRELLSSELWEAVNDLHLTLGRRDLRRDLDDQPHELFTLVRRACMAIYGTASETMPRDDGWRFMALGRVLERASVTCRLVDVRYGQLEALAGPSRRLAAPPPAEILAGRDGLVGLAASEDEVARGADRADFHHWIAVLKSASSFEAYRRRYRASMDPADVVEFLLLAPDLPRSVVFCLSTAQNLLADLSGGRPSRAARRVGRVCSSLRYRDVDDLFDAGLHEVLAATHADLAGVADAVADEFFRHHPDGVLHAIATS